MLGLLEKRTQVVGVLLACCLYFFFFLRSCSVILFYFLALQAAGRMTWLPGKPLGKCAGLLPASGLPARIPLPPAPPCQAGVEGAGTAASQASAPTLPRLGADLSLQRQGASPAQGSGCAASPRPPARTGLAQCLRQALFLLFFIFKSLPLGELLWLAICNNQFETTV